MTQDRVNKTVLLCLVLSVSLLFLWMIRGYLMALFMAALFSALLSPAHRALTRRLGGREQAASLILLMAVVLLVLTPCVILGGVVFGQALNVSESVTPWVHGFINEPSGMNKYLEKIPFYERLAPYRSFIIQKLGQAVGMVSGFLVNSLSSLTKMTLNALMGIAIMLYCMFFLLVKGDALLRKILYFLPLKDEDERLLLRRFTSVTAATLKGTLIIGALQGLSCGAGFAAAGVEGAVFWGTVAAALSIVPVVGTSLLWAPAAVIFLIKGQYWNMTLILVICGGLCVCLDNLLRPRLVGKNTQMHELFVLLSTLGGIGMFGILGIIVGPIIAALFITLWELYGRAFAPWLPPVSPETVALGIADESGGMNDAGGAAGAEAGAVEHDDAADAGRAAALSPSRRTPRTRPPRTTRRPQPQRTRRR